MILYHNALKLNCSSWRLIVIPIMYSKEVIMIAKRRASLWNSLKYIEAHLISSLSLS